MFFTFLQKQQPDYLELSALLNYTPRAVFYYYYNSSVIIPLDAYDLLNKIVVNEPDLAIPAQIWLDFFHKELSAYEDLSCLLASEYLETLGPYYYPPTNSRIYFSRCSPLGSQVLTAHDLNTLTSLESSIPIIKSLQDFIKLRKPSKKTAQSKDDLLKELEMCLLSLQEIEKINRHMNYLRKVLALRYALVEDENLQPMEPDNVPLKPAKISEPDSPLSNIISLAWASRWKREPNSEASRYNFEMKIYIIRYREYEKTCDRYKDFLEHWPEHHQEFMNRCFQDIEHAEDKLKAADRYTQLCNHVLLKSCVHLKYLDETSLNTFKQYLETGRTSNIQECMNLYEEDLHWNEIKASQERIENTIYFLQSANEYALLADEQIDQIVKNKKITL